MAKCKCTDCKCDNWETPKKINIKIKSVKYDKIEIARDMFGCTFLVLYGEFNFLADKIPYTLPVHYVAGEFHYDYGSIDDHIIDSAIIKLDSFDTKYRPSDNRIRTLLNDKKYKIVKW